MEIFLKTVKYQFYYEIYNFVFIQSTTMLMEKDGNKLYM